MLQNSVIIKVSSFMDLWVNVAMKIDSIYIFKWHKMLVKSALKMRLRRSKIQKFSTQGKGPPLPLEPYPPQTRPLGPRRDPAPPWKKASCASAHLYSFIRYNYSKVVLRPDIS